MTSATRCLKTVPRYTLAVQISCRRAPGPLNLLVDIEPWERHWSE